MTMGSQGSSGGHATGGTGKTRALKKSTRGKAQLFMRAVAVRIGMQVESHCQEKCCGEENEQCNQAYLGGIGNGALGRRSGHFRSKGQSRGSMGNRCQGGGLGTTAGRVRGKRCARWVGHDDEGNIEGKGYASG